MIALLSDALAERGYDTLTDVQNAVTAPELDNADLLVSAQTGSGKTVAFGLAIGPTLLGDSARLGPAAAPLALIVAPTRELAMQVSRELSWLYEKAGARVVTCIGGMDAREERRALDRGAHIVVGTPGRLSDHINRGALDLTDIRAAVLDEADEMLDLGFREDLEFILSKAPASRRTLMFSATVPPTIAQLAKTYQRDAVRVATVSKGTQHADITYQAVQVAPADTEHAIINLLRYHDAPTAIVFANTRATVARLTARFANRGLSVVSLSGELSQDERSHALQALRDGRARVCVATDVAARGLDLPNLDLVIHADLPTNTEALLHRSGRTGRAGRKGLSALIVPDKITNKASRLLKWAKITAEWTAAPTPDQIRMRDEERLLSDPAWTTPPSEDETAFAARLLEQYTPEAIAAACLRLYRTRLSAPEELNTRTHSAPRDVREEFGPSRWIALSVGRDKGAEARWLLPMLCRTGNLDKAQIGKIRVQDTETMVELAEAALAPFVNRLGKDAVLEEDVRVRVLDGAPPSGPPSHDRKPQHARKSFNDNRPAPGPKPPRKPAPSDAPRADAKPSDRAPSKPYSKPKPRRDPEVHGAAPKRDRDAKPYQKDKPPRKPAPQGDAKAKRPPHKGSAAQKDRAPQNAKPAAPAKPPSKLRAGASDPSKPMGRRKPQPKGGEAKPRRKP